MYYLVGARINKPPTIVADTAFPIDFIKLYFPTIIDLGYISDDFLDELIANYYGRVFVPVTVAVRST